ncbi:unnamed protein product, partial [marine sediment metagenome]
EEVSIFQKHAPIPREEVNEVSHQILMKVVPGLLKKDLICFGEGIKRIQNIGFKKIEISLQHEVVKNLLNLLNEYGVKAYGMSSFGPSVVGITESNQEAAELFDKSKTGTFISLSAIITSGSFSSVTFFDVAM